MRVVLTGAGASYGASGVTPSQPPLGGGLFDELRAAYPEVWGKIPESDRRSFVPNFEVGMKQWWESGSHTTPVLMRCMADFFARFRTEDSNSYARLIEHLEYRGAFVDTAFSTINYECLLETAARGYGMGIEYCSKEPSGADSMTLWKIHGSCNFLPASVSGSGEGVSFSGNALKWDGEVRVVDPSQVGPFVARNAFYPAMAVFMEGKPVHSHQSVIVQLQGWWQSALAEAEAVGVIGVRPNVDDSHIWDHLASTPGKLVIVGNREENEQWAEQYREGRPTVVVGTRFDGSLKVFAEEFATP